MTLLFGVHLKQSLLIKNCRLFDVQETMNYADLDRRGVQELKEDTDLDKSAVQIFMKVAIIATTNPFELPHLAKFRVLSSQQPAAIQKHPCGCFRLNYLFVFRPWVVLSSFVVLGLCLREDYCAVWAAVEEQVVCLIIVDYCIYS